MNKLNCRECSKKILRATFNKNGGLCMPCFHQSNPDEALKSKEKKAGIWFTDSWWFTGILGILCFYFSTKIYDAPLTTYRALGILLNYIRESVGPEISALIPLLIGLLLLKSSYSKFKAAKNA